MTFTNQAVVVTGGASGIGAATARAFARLGAAVLIVDRQPADAVLDAIASDGGTASALIGDLARAETAKAAVDAAIDRYGP